MAISLFLTESQSGTSVEEMLSKVGMCGYRFMVRALSLPDQCLTISGYGDRFFSASLNARKMAFFHLYSPEIQG
jgi:hypothetical protein